MGLAQDLAGHIVATDFASLDPEAVEWAKWRVLDVCGCALAGAEAPGCGMMKDLVTDWGGAEEATILAHGGRAPAHNAAMMNTLMARSHDYEPVEAEFEGHGCPAHISGTTVPVALAMAEKQRADGEHLLTALIIGDDIAAGLAVNSGFDFDLGWDETGTVNVFGAATVACKLLRLNEQRIFDALGIALNRLSGSIAGIFDKTLCYKLPMACSSREGIFAAELAERGFQGIVEPFLGPRGYFSMFCRNHSADQVAKNLGRKFYSDCVIKPYSACRITHPFIDSALAIATSHDIDAEQIATITIHGTHFGVDSFCAQPLPSADVRQPDAAFSIRYCVATALLFRDVAPPQFGDEFLRDPRTRDLAGRIELVGDLPQREPGDNQVRMEVTMTDGSSFLAHTLVGKGDMREGRVNLSDVQAKFLANASFAGLDSGCAEQVMEMIDRLEELEDVRPLMRLLVKGES
jgi:2-methylcitrate dehydratase PrpD